MAGERQTEPHQAGPTKREEAAILEGMSFAREAERERERADEAEADVARLRAQNKAHAERRDQELAGYQKRVARTDHLMAEARRRMEHAAVDWTTDPPSQKPGGWWNYTSISNAYEVAVLVAEITQARTDTVNEIVAWLQLHGSPDIGGGYRDAAIEIEREFGCPEENGDTDG